MIFIAAMAVMIQASIASTTGVINYDTVRVRKDPEPDLKKTKTYALVSIGDKVEVLEKTGDWYKITCTYEGKKVTGYVREDLIDVKNSEDVPVIDTSDKDDDDNSSNNNNNSNSNSNSNSSSNANSNTNNNTKEPNETNNNTSSNTTSTSNSNSSSEKPSEGLNNQTEQPTNTNEPAQNQAETTLTTVKVAQNEIKKGNKIKLEKDVYIKIIPVVNSTNIGTITSGTEVTVVEIVNKWIRIETEELIGWARIE